MASSFSTGLYFRNHRSPDCTDGFFIACGRRSSSSIASRYRYTSSDDGSFPFSCIQRDGNSPFMPCRNSYMEMHKGWLWNHFRIVYSCWSLSCQARTGSSFHTHHCFHEKQDSRKHRPPGGTFTNRSSSLDAVEHPFNGTSSAFNILCETTRIMVHLSYFRTTRFTERSFDYFAPSAFYDSCCNCGTVQNQEKKASRSINGTYSTAAFRCILLPAA